MEGRCFGGGGVMRVGGNILNLCCGVMEDSVGCRVRRGVRRMGGSVEEGYAILSLDRISAV